MYIYIFFPHCEKKGLFFPEGILNLNLDYESSICSLSQFCSTEKHKKEENLNNFFFLLQCLATTAAKFGNIFFQYCFLSYYYKVLVLLTSFCFLFSVS